MGRFRTNHRNNYNHAPSSTAVIAELQELMGTEKANEYLADYPTAALKIYAADVMVRSIKSKSTVPHQTASEA